ncbi:hypothetical protein [Dyella sp.]|nr:hypothetical protein [Dyella sp.]HET7330133.1 hypothetical protein [Dyella sp.]
MSTASVALAFRYVYAATQRCGLMCINAAVNLVLEGLIGVESQLRQ